MSDGHALFSYLIICSLFLSAKTPWCRHIQRMVLETYVYQLSAVCQSFYLPHGHISRG